MQKQGQAEINSSMIPKYLKLVVADFFHIIN